jgi:hypothetical protein
MEFGDFAASICSCRRLVASCEEVWGHLVTRVERLWFLLVPRIIRHRWFLSETEPWGFMKWDFTLRDCHVWQKWPNVWLGQSHATKRVLSAHCAQPWFSWTQVTRYWCRWMIGKCFSIHRMVDGMEMYGIWCVVRSLSPDPPCLCDQDGDLSLWLSCEDSDNPTFRDFEGTSVQDSCYVKVKIMVWWCFAVPS